MHSNCQAEAKARSNLPNFRALSTSNIEPDGTQDYSGKLTSRPSLQDTVRGMPSERRSNQRCLRPFPQRICGILGIACNSGGPGWSSQSVDRTVLFVRERRASLPLLPRCRPHRLHLLLSHLPWPLLRYRRLSAVSI